LHFVGVVEMKTIHIKLVTLYTRKVTVNFKPWLHYHFGKTSCKSDSRKYLANGRRAWGLSYV